MGDENESLAGEGTDHPANMMLNLYEPMAASSPSVPFSDAYEPLETGPAPVLLPGGQQMPGRAVLSVKERARAAEPVPPPDLKSAKLVDVKADDGEEVEMVRDARVRRQLFEVTIGPRLKRGGALGKAPEELDTAEVKQKSSGFGPAMLGLNRQDSERFRQLAQEWVDKSLIWVCCQEKGRIGPTFYSHVGQYHKFHHSSFTARESLLAAGEWIVEKGVLKRINANSGHYLPETKDLHRAVLYLSAACTAETEVMLYNTKADNWEYVPVNHFKADPYGGNKYKSHPAAVS